MGRRVSCAYSVRLARGGFTGVGAGLAAARVAAVARIATRVLTSILVTGC